MGWIADFGGFLWGRAKYFDVFLDSVFVLGGRGGIDLNVPFYSDIRYCLFFSRKYPDGYFSGFLLLSAFFIGKLAKVCDVKQKFQTRITFYQNKIVFFKIKFDSLFRF